MWLALVWFTGIRFIPRQEFFLCHHFQIGSAAHRASCPICIRGGGGSTFIRELYLHYPHIPYRGWAPWAVGHTWGSCVILFSLQTHYQKIRRVLQWKLKASDEVITPTRASQYWRNIFACRMKLKRLFFGNVEDDRWSLSFAFGLIAITNEHWNMKLFFLTSTCFVCIVLKFHSSITAVLIVAFTDILAKSRIGGNWEYTSQPARNRVFSNCACENGT